jgi:hypothetical protein
MPTGEFGTVRQVNEDDALVKWDDDGRIRVHQPSLKKMEASHLVPTRSPLLAPEVSHCAQYSKSDSAKLATSVEGIHSHENCRTCRRITKRSLGQAKFNSYVVFSSAVRGLAANAVCSARPTGSAAATARPANADTGSIGTAYAQQSPEELQRLVAPIALYPDSLVAQILAAATFPEQVVEADRWVQANPDLKGDALGRAVDQQPWDPSVKALTAFPSVLGNMDKNLSWASSLGDAYFNQQADVMDAVQVMRRRAQAAGDLKTTSQQNVTTQDSTISVQPSDPQTVYVPAYDPWLAYGEPINAWPGWYPYPGIWFGGPYLSWGGGFGIGWFGGYGWGWNHWGFNWGGRYAMYGGGRYYSRSNTFYNRSNFYRAGSARRWQRYAGRNCIPCLCR